MAWTPWNTSWTTEGAMPRTSSDAPVVHRFADRRAAGRELAAVLRRQSLGTQLVVLGLPRGGVPVAEEVARALRAPLDVMVVRKIGFPAQPELAIGAIAAGDIVVHEPSSLPYGSVPQVEFEQLVQRERLELSRRERLYRRGREPLRLAGGTVVLIDDGIATGATMLAAVRASRAANALSVTVGAPVASQEAVSRLRGEVDELVILETPPTFLSVGEWYEQFTQTSDDEVRNCLRRVAKGH